MSRPRYLVTDQGGRIPDDDRRMAETLAEWCQRHDGRRPSGALVIPFYEGGFALQYLGSEQLDAAQLIERLLWIAGQVAEGTPQ